MGKGHGKKAKCGTFSEFLCDPVISAAILVFALIILYFSIDEFFMAIK